MTDYREVPLALSATDKKPRENWFRILLDLADGSGLEIPLSPDATEHLALVLRPNRPQGTIANPRHVELDQLGHYILPTAEAFVDLLPPKGEEKARIRLQIAPGKQLDLPLKEDSLKALNHSLSRLLGTGKFS
jgi:hypothetical protein